MIEPALESEQIARAVSVRVLERAGIDLVDDCFVPPRHPAGHASGRPPTAARGPPLRAGPLRGGCHLLVLAFTELLDDLLGERRDVVGLAASHEALVHVYLV